MVNGEVKMAKRGRPPKNQPVLPEGIDINTLYEMLKKLVEEKSVAEKPKPKPKPKGKPVKKTAVPKKTKPKPVKVATAVPVENPPTVNSPTNKNDFANCIAPSRKSQEYQEGQKITKDGKEYTISRKVQWEPKSEPNKFKDSAALAKKEKLNYPEPTLRRDPAQKYPFKCDFCGETVMIYEGEHPGDESLFRCDGCITGRRKKRGRH